MKYNFSLTDPEDEFRQAQSDIFRFIETYGPSSVNIFPAEEIPGEDGLVLGGSYGTLQKVFTPEIMEALDKVDGMDEQRNSLYWKAVVYSITD